MRKILNHKQSFNENRSQSQGSRRLGQSQIPRTVIGNNSLDEVMAAPPTDKPPTSSLPAAVEKSVALEKAPQKSMASWSDMFPSIPEQDGRMAILGIIGAIAGVVLFPKHRVLAGIGGLTLGASLPDLATPGKRAEAVAGIGVAAAGIGASLAAGNHPVMGFVGGIAAGSAATTYLARRYGGSNS